MLLHLTPMQLLLTAEPKGLDAVSCLNRLDIPNRISVEMSVAEQLSNLHSRSVTLDEGIMANSSLHLHLNQCVIRHKVLGRSPG